MSDSVKGTTRISPKHQITLPVAALRESGLEIGDRLKVIESGPGHIHLIRIDNLVAEFAGALTGRIDRTLLDELDTEWE